MPTNRKLEEQISGYFEWLEAELGTTLRPPDALVSAESSNNRARRRSAQVLVVALAFVLIGTALWSRPETTTVGITAASASPVTNEPESSIAAPSDLPKTWAPVDLPPGLTLVDVTHGVRLPSLIQSHNHLQRFNRAGAQPATVDVTFSDQAGETVGNVGGSVHGQAAVVARADSSSPLLVWWIEGDQNISVNAYGLSETETVALLNDAAWRSDPKFGFDPSSIGGGFAPFIDGHVGQAIDYSGYTILARDQTMIRVEVSPTAWHLPNSPDETSIRFDGRLFGQFLVADEFEAQIGFWQLGQEPAADDIAAIANSFVKLNDADLATVTTTARANLSALPEIDSTEVGGSRIVQRGSDVSRPIALCLRDAGAEVCRSLDFSPATSREARIAARSVLVNDQWRIFGYWPVGSPVTGEGAISPNRSICSSAQDGTIVNAIDDVRSEKNGASYFIVEVPNDAQFVRGCDRNTTPPTPDSSTLMSRPAN